MRTHDQRAGYSLLLLITFVAGTLLLMGSCNTFERAQRKFATTVVDTVYHTTTHIIQHDSARIVLPTDTTYENRTVQQGRARLTFNRNRQTTSVKADCLPDTVTKTDTLYHPKQFWGVDTKFKQEAIENAEAAARWRSWFWYLLIAVVVAVALYVLFGRFFRINISKR